MEGRQSMEAVALLSRVKSQIFWGNKNLESYQRGWVESNTSILTKKNKKKTKNSTTKMLQLAYQLPAAALPTIYVCVH